jgi:2'-5' RNA ligase
MSIRAFISIDVEASEKMRGFHSDLKGANAQVKLVNLDIMHLTLKFLGDTSESLLPEIIDLMDTSVDGMEPFTIELRGTGAFPNLNRMKVVWIGVKRIGEMKSIADYLDGELANLGFKKERRKFSPHLTIGRVKGGRNKHKLAEVISNWEDEDFGAMDVDSIRLKKSVLSPQGPSYSTLHESKIQKD